VVAPQDQHHRRLPPKKRTGFRLKERGCEMDFDWNGLADLLANLIAKYADTLDLDNLPSPTPEEENNEKIKCIYSK